MRSIRLEKSLFFTLPLGIGNSRYLLIFWVYWKPVILENFVIFCLEYSWKLKIWQPLRPFLGIVSYKKGPKWYFLFFMVHKSPSVTFCGTSFVRSFWFFEWRCLVLLFLDLIIKLNIMHRYDVINTPFHINIYDFVSY